MSSFEKKEQNLNQLIDKLNSLSLSYSQPNYELEKIRTEKNDLTNSIIISDDNSLKNINKSARNIKDVKIIKDDGANIYDLFKYKNVLITSSSAKKLESRILNEKN